MNVELNSQNYMYIYTYIYIYSRSLIKNWPSPDEECFTGSFLNHRCVQMLIAFFADR